MTGPVADSVLVAARAAAGLGAWGEVRATLERDADTTAADGSRAMLLGEACLRTGDPASATRWLDAAAPLLVRAGNRYSSRNVTNMQGAAAFALGSLDRAADRFGVALELARADDDALLTARAINNLGAIDALRGNADRAIAAYQLAIPAYQRMGHLPGLAESWHNLAISLRTRGELNAADEAERRAIEYAVDARNTRLAAMAQVGRAEVSLRRSDFAWARATASRAAAIFASLPDFLLQSDALRVQADAADRLGLREEADTALLTALVLARTHGHRVQLAQALQTQAQMLARRGSVVEARGVGEASRDAFTDLGSTEMASEVAEFLAGLPRDN